MDRKNMACRCGSDHATPKPIDLSGSYSLTRNAMIADRRISWITAAAFAGIVAFALLIRHYRLDAESLWMDEIVTVETFHRSPAGIVTGAAMEGQPPLENFVGAAIHRIGLGQSDWWVRFPAAIYGTAAVLLLGLWVRRLAGDLAGLAAAVLLAVCPLHAHMSQEARPYALMFFLALACGLCYIRARQRQSAGAWILFSVITFAMLMTRWTDPHFIVLGIGLYALAKVKISKSQKARIQVPGTGLLAEGDTFKSLERLLFRRTFVSLMAAYVCYAPFFVIVLSYQRAVVRAPGGDWKGRFVSLIHESFAALFAGYSTRAVFSALPGSRWLVLTGGLLALVGLLLALVRARRSQNEATAFWWMFVPFPFVYALIYALLGDAVPKPQYLLIMAIPVIAGIAIVLTELPRMLPRFARPIAIAAGLMLFVLPMGRQTLAALERIDKRDWRGAMGFLKEQSSPGDVAVCIGSDTIPPAFRPKAYGKDRYGPAHLKVIPISVDTPLGDFSTVAWQAGNNTVWMLVYTDRMYTGIDQLSPPSARPGLRVETFEGLFVVGITGTGSAFDRLMATIEHWYTTLPDGRSLLAPAVLRWRYAMDRGQAVEATACLQTARRQCLTRHDRVELEKWLFSLETQGNGVVQAIP